MGALIWGYVWIKGKTLEEIGKIMGCSRPTVSKKLNDPGELTIKELQALQKGLDVPAEAFQTAVDNLFLNKPASK